MELNAVVMQRIDITHNLIILRLVPEGWELPEFKPGQFAVLGLPGTTPRCPGSEKETPLEKPAALIRRAYSIASSSVAREYIEFYIQLVPSGALTPRLFTLKVGDRIWMNSKFTGMFTLDRVPEDQNVVFVATGTGLAPYMSMLRTHLECNGARHFAVYHGALHSWELGYRTELTSFQHLCSNFQYFPVISEPAGERLPWKGPVGFVQEHWRKEPLEKHWGFRPTPENTHFFLCGNPLMITGMLETLAEEGFVEHTKKQPGQIHLEKFW